MAFMVAIVISLAVGAAVLAPLVRRMGGRGAPAGSGPSRVQALLDQRETFLNALADLETDRALGNIDQEEYQQLRGGYEAQAAVVLKQLDGLSAGVSTAIEAEVAEARRRRGQQGIIGAAMPCPHCGASTNPAGSPCVACGYAGGAA